MANNKTALLILNMAITITTAVVSGVIRTAVEDMTIKEKVAKAVAEATKGS